jgi:hypothetical protein
MWIIGGRGGKRPVTSAADFEIILIDFFLIEAERLLAPKHLNIFTSSLSALKLSVA